MASGAASSAIALNLQSPTAIDVAVTPAGGAATHYVLVVPSVQEAYVKARSLGLSAPLDRFSFDPWTKPRYDGKRRALAEFAKREGISMDTPWRSLSTAQRQALLSGRSRGYKGILPFLADLEEKRYKQYIRVFLRQYQSARECPTCAKNKSLPPLTRQVRVVWSAVGNSRLTLISALSIWR